MSDLPVAAKMHEGARPPEITELPGMPPAVVMLLGFAKLPEVLPPLVLQLLSWL